MYSKEETAKVDQLNSLVGKWRRATWYIFWDVVFNKMSMRPCSVFRKIVSIKEEKVVLIRDLIDNGNIYMVSLWNVFVSEQEAKQKMDALNKQLKVK